MARTGDEVRLRGRAIPHSVDVAVYRQRIDELPGDCVVASWLIDGVEQRRAFRQAIDGLASRARREIEIYYRCIL